MQSHQILREYHQTLSLCRPYTPDWMLTFGDNTENGQLPSIFLALSQAKQYDIMQKPNPATTANQTLPRRQHHMQSEEQQLPHMPHDEMVHCML